MKIDIVSSTFHDQFFMESILLFILTIGLLVFYEIFKFLEEALERHKDSLIGDLLIPGYLCLVILD